MLRRIPKSARVAAEFIASVGFVVWGLSGDHPALALALGIALAFVLVLDLFGEVAWNGIAAAVVRNALGRGLLAPDDPDATQRERQLRAYLRHLITELDDAERLVENASSSGVYWVHPGTRPDTHAWQASEWFISEWPGLGRLYEALHEAYTRLRRAHLHSLDENRVAEAGKGRPVLEQDDLLGLLDAIEVAQRELRSAVERLDTPGH
jgi:hypothetical protein